MAPHCSMALCRTPADLALIDGMVKSGSPSIVVATDSAAVRTIALRDTRVSTVAYLDQGTSIFDVLSDALVIYERMNDWLNETVPDEPAYLMEWAKHIEGGMTTQKIVDVMILIRSYQHLLRSFGVQALYLRHSLDTAFEDDIIIRVARSIGVPVHAHRTVLYLAARFFQLKRVSLRRAGLGFRAVLPSFLIQTALKIDMLAGVLAVLVKRTGISRNVQYADVKIVLFLLGSSSDKHVDNISGVMKAIDDRDGFRSLALCWQSRGGYRKIRSRGLHAQYLEQWIDLRGLASALFRYRRAKRALFRNLRQFHRNRQFQYDGIALNGPLSRSIEHFARVDLLNRFLMHQALTTLFSRHTPAAMKTYGGLRLDYGRIASEVLKARNNTSLVFQYWLGINMDLRFGPSPARLVDILFVHGEADREYAQRMSPGTDIIVAGYPRMNNIAEMRSISPAESLGRIGVHNRRGIVLCYASTGVLTGYISAREAYEVAETVLSLAAQDADVLLLMKPHPEEDTSYFTDLYVQYGKPENVVILGKNAPIYHCINASDCVITTFSTVGLESMMLDRPVISLSLDGEPRLQEIFGDGAVKFRKKDAFTAFMRSLIASKSDFLAWKEQRKRAHRSYLQRKVYDPPIPVESVIADEVLGRLSGAVSHTNIAAPV